MIGLALIALFVVAEIAFFPVVMAALLAAWLFEGMSERQPVKLCKGDFDFKCMGV